MDLLRRIWNAWRAFGRLMADAVGRVAMFVLYFTLVAPFGLAVRLFSDPLQLKQNAPRWDPRETEHPTLQSSSRTF